MSCSFLRFELTCEWDVKRQNFKCYYTFYRTSKKQNGTMEHKASDHIRVKVMKKFSFEVEDVVFNLRLSITSNRLEE